MAKLKTPKDVFMSAPVYNDYELLGVYIANRIKQTGDAGHIIGNLEIGSQLAVDGNGDRIKEKKIDAPYVLISPDNVVVDKRHIELTNDEITVELTNFYTTAVPAIAAIIDGAGTSAEKAMQIIAALEIETVIKAVLYPKAMTELGVTEADLA